MRRGEEVGRTGSCCRIRPRGGAGRRRFSVAGAPAAQLWHRTATSFYGRRMAQSVEDLLRELVALTRQQLANQQSAMARQEELMVQMKRRAWTSTVRLVAIFALIGFVIYLSVLVQSFRR